MHFARIARTMSCLAVASIMPGCPQFGDLMRLYGYTELLPPSTLLAPGAMVTSIADSRIPAVTGTGAKAKYKLICGPRASLGPNWAPNTSSTITRSLQKHNGKSFHLSADVLQTIHAKTEFSAITDITATLTNPKLVELEDLDIIANLKYRSRECQRAVDLRTRNGFPVTMISSGLMGDVQYVVHWQTTNTIDAGARIQAMQHLAIELGAGNSFVTEDSIRATNLTYGVKDDQYLSSLTLTDIDETTVKRGSRLISIEEVANVELDPDAPVVPPPLGKCKDGTCPTDGRFDAGVVPIEPRDSMRSDKRARPMRFVDISGA